MPGISSNLLPNASFELGLGQGVPTNWANPLNDLTFRLVADKSPLAVPVMVARDDAPHSSLVARLDVTPERAQHLTSAVVSLEGARGYVLSAYVRSDTPGAKLRLCLWNRPLDWSVQPDAQSPEIDLTDKWKRYQFRFISGCRAGPGAAVEVVDRAASVVTEGQVWVADFGLSAATCNRGRIRGRRYTSSWDGPDRPRPYHD